MSKKKGKKTSARLRMSPDFPAKELTKVSKAIGKIGATEGEKHLAALRKGIQAAADAGDMQTARSLAYQLAHAETVRDRARARRDAVRALARVGLDQSDAQFQGDGLQQQYDEILAGARARRLGSNDNDQPDAILRAAEPSIRRAQRPRSDGGRKQRSELRSAYDGTYPAEHLDERETMLDSQRKIQEAEEEMRKAVTPAEREAAGYRLTRARLVDGHRRGVI